MKITADIKRGILEALNKGETSTDVAKRFNVAPVTIRSLKHRATLQDATQRNVSANIRNDGVANASVNADVAKSATFATPSPTIKTVAKPESNVGATTGTGAGGAEGARNALQRSATPPIQTVDPLLLQQQEQKFCIDTITSMKAMMGGMGCLLLDVNSQDKRIAPQLALTPIAQETVRANAEFLYPHLQHLFGNHLMLYMVLGMEAATMGSVIYKVYQEQHPKDERVQNQEPPPPQKPSEPQTRAAGSGSTDPYSPDFIGRQH